MCGHCNKAMQMCLEDDRVKGDPFKMMEMIKSKMHDPSKVKCPCATSFEQLERLLNTKQEEDEPLMEHTKSSNRHKTMSSQSWVQNGETNLQRTQRNALVRQTMISKKQSRKQAASHSWHVHF